MLYLSVFNTNYYFVVGSFAFIFLLLFNIFCSEKVLYHILLLSEAALVVFKC